MEDFKDLDTGRQDERGADRSAVAVNLDPILAGLFRRLPKVGEQWAYHKRAAWLRAMASAFELIYGPDVTETVIGIRLAHQTPAGQPLESPATALPYATDPLGLTRPKTKEPDPK